VSYVFPVVFSMLVLMSLLSIYSNIVMRIRLTKAEPSRDKLVWWRRGSDEVDAMYEELFPGSYLPRFSQFAFWLVLALASAVLVATLRKSH
jgi:hypothetical protein